MVLESIVTSVLNRFLGDFIENLDASHLNLGIWGGNAELKNLNVKSTALDDFDLPIRLKFGCLDRLLLQIPWKKLYTEPVVATIDGLFLVLVPNKGVRFDEKKAEKHELEAKRKALDRLEGLRKERRKPKEKTGDTFADKLVAQIVKNLQVHIENIHVRYEDEFTDNSRPFAVGATLQSLHFDTTDEDWKRTIHKETMSVFYKLVHMESLSLYWNSKTSMIADSDDRAAIRRRLVETIGTGDSRPAGFKYFVQPIGLDAKLQLNQKPEQDKKWAVPKVELDLGLDQLAVQIDRQQFQEFLSFLEAVERFNTAALYLKYRPQLTAIKGHSKEWWKFAYTALFEEQIRRKRHNWSWERMRKHRALFHDYRRAWIRKQTEKSPPSDVVALLQKAEKKLDVFNLNLARQQAELEIDRRRLTRVEDQPQGWMGWAASWWGGDKKAEEPSDLVAQMKQAMTAAEKQKLYAALDYAENTPPPDFPKTFVENRVRLRLLFVSVRVEEFLEFRLDKIGAKVEHRPSARAFSLNTTVRSLELSGYKQRMATVMKKEGDWLRLDVEKSPLGGEADYAVGLRVSPLLLRYHAPAVNSAVEVFRPPAALRLDHLMAAAWARLEEAKSDSLAGLRLAVEQRAKWKLDVRIEPLAFALCEGGGFNAKRPTLIAELGLLTLQSTDENSESTHKSSGSKRLRELVQKAYDKFELKVVNIRLLFDRDFHSCWRARDESDSAAHILRPTGLSLALHISIRVIGDLPDIVLKMSDERLLELAKLVVGLPLPDCEESTLELEAQIPQLNVKDRAKMHAIMEAHEMEEPTTAKQPTRRGRSAPKKKRVDGKKAEGRDSSSSTTSTVRQQLVQLDVQLRWNQIGVEIRHQQKLLVVANVRRLGFQFQLRSFDLLIRSQLGSITVEMPTFKSLMPHRSTLFLIDNEHSKPTENLAEVTFVQANTRPPFFVEEYKKTEQKVECHFKKLNVTLHQEALVVIKRFIDRVDVELQRIEAEKKAETPASSATRAKRKGSMFSFSTTNLHRSESQIQMKRQREQRRREKPVDEAFVRWDVQAEFAALSVLVGTNRGADTSFEISGATAVYVMKQKEACARVTLSSVQMLDETPTATHKRLLAVVSEDGEEMFQLELLQHLRSDEQRRRLPIEQEDVRLKIRLARLRFVFLKLWVNRMLCWIEPFEREAAALAQQVSAERPAGSALKNRKEIPLRVLLDVELNAPAVVVPLRSSSNQMLLFDFGRLVVKNKFVRVKGAIVDQLLVSMKDVHAASGLLDKDSMSVLWKCNLLKPLSFELTVRRNLSFDSNKSVPAISLDAHVPQIDLSMSRQDYAKILQTVDGNLAEGTPPRSRPVSAQKGDKTATPVSSELGGTHRKTPSSQTPQPSKEAASKTKKAAGGQRVVFQLEVDDVDICLYAGDTAVEEQKGLIERRATERFAQMKGGQLEVGGRLNAHGGLEVAVHLFSFTVDDKREGEAKIPHLLEKKPTEKPDRLLSLVFKQAVDGNRIVDLNTSALTLYLCPKFLGALSAFFSSELPEEQRAARVDVKLPLENPQPSAEAPRPLGTLAVRCRVKDVEVVLVENSEDLERSRAIFLRFNATADVKELPELRRVSARINALRIVSSQFAAHKRAGCEYAILAPMDVTIDGRLHLRTLVQNFAVHVEQIELKISPEVLGILSNFSTNFADSKRASSQKSLKPPALPEYPDYFEAKPFNRDDFWWFAAATREAGARFRQPEPPPRPTEHKQNAELSIGRVRLTVESGLRRLTPAVLFEVQVGGRVHDWSELLSLELAVRLTAHSFNEQAGVWEPVVEPLQRERGQWESPHFKLQLQAHSEKEVNVSATGRPLPAPEFTVHVQTADIVNVTITKSFVRLLTQLGESFGEATKPPAGSE